MQSLPLNRPRPTANLRVQGTTFRAVQEVLLIAAAVFLYFFVRGLVDGREADAFTNAADLIALEQRLGIFWEPTIQSWALAWASLTTLANWVYIWGHWPVIAGTFIWLLVAHREAFPVYRNALLLSGAIGLVFFATYPVAPPRFLETLGFVDTITLHSNSYRVLQPPSLANPYAAMPSLHGGWNLLMGIAIFRQSSRRLPKLFGLLMPVAMFAAIVLTANHYILDGVVGALVALTGLTIALKLHRTNRQPSEARTEQVSAPGQA